MAEGGGATTSSENEDYLESNRRKRIQDLVRGIAAKKMKKQKLTGKEMHMENPKKKQRGTGRHPQFKLHVGWLHETRGRYRHVTARKGGGTRVYEFDRDVEQTVESITNYATRIFFPEGKSDVGDLSEMEVTLSSYNGESIQKFTGTDGKECCLQEYLKSIGVYSSQFYLYLRTSKKQQITEEPLSEDLNKTLSEEPQNTKSKKSNKSHCEEAEPPSNKFNNPLDESPSKDSKKSDKTLCEESPGEQILTGGSFPDPSDPLFVVNGQTPGEICVCYTKTCHSLYSEEQSLDFRISFKFGHKNSWDKSFRFI